MARFYGKIGYGTTVETPPGSGIWEDQIEEFSYYGDVIRDTRKLERGEGLNDNVVITGNSISIVADRYAIEHFFNIRYVEWEGALWIVQSVTVNMPRLILSLGSVYNGPTDGTP